MRPIIYAIAILSFLLLLSCKAQQYTLDNLPEKQLVFGKGGGITGAVDTYVLLENGQLFHSNSMTNEGNELEGAHKKEAKEYYAKMKLLELSKMEFNHPGNTYFFLEEIDTTGTHKVVWGSNDHQAPEACENFYQELKELIK